jgi:hypothetical protein
MFFLGGADERFFGAEGHGFGFPCTHLGLLTYFKVGVTEINRDITNFGDRTFN